MGNIGVGEVGKEMGRRWGQLDEEGKEKYKAAFLKDKARYEEERKNYQPSEQFLEMKAEQAKRQKKQAGVETVMEKYFSFLLASWRKVSEENPSLGAKEVQEMVWLQWTRGKMGMGDIKQKTKKVRDPAAPKKPMTAFFLFQKKMRMGGLAMNSKAVAEMWNKLDKEGKQPFKDEEEELKGKYLKEVEVFKSNKGEEGA